MTIERPMFPPVDQARRKSAAPFFKIVAGRDFEPPAPEQPKRKGGRRSNPLRVKFVTISSAVTIAGKMHVYADLCPAVSEMWLEKLRSGAESARIVAKELGQAAASIKALIAAQSAKAVQP